MSRSNKTSLVLNLIQGSAQSGNPLMRGSMEKPAKKEMPAENVQQYVSAEYFPPKPKKKSRIGNKNCLTDTETELKNPMLKPHEALPKAMLMQNGGFQIINVASVLVNEQLGTVMSRFHVCSCDRCLKEITARVMKELPPMFIKVNCKADAEKLEQTLESQRANVIKVLTKVMISVKANPVHK